MATRLFLPWRVYTRGRLLFYGVRCYACLVPFLSRRSTTLFPTVSLPPSRASVLHSWSILDVFYLTFMCVSCSYLLHGISFASTSHVQPAFNSMYLPSRSRLFNGSRSFSLMTPSHRTTKVRGSIRASLSTVHTRVMMSPHLARTSNLHWLFRKEKTFGCTPTMQKELHSATAVALP